MHLSTLDVADMVRELVEIRDRADKLLQVLLPDGDTPACTHPPEYVKPDITLDDDPDVYRCTKCGAESPIPFPTIISGS